MLHETNQSTLERAILFSVKAHTGQTRKGDGRPYILHPLSVMFRVDKNKKSTNRYLLAVAAILHDTVEDCGITLQQIAEEFGYQVAALVDELTLNKAKYESIGKKEYLAQELYGMSSYALTIKLCDRLDNLEDMESMSESFQQKYKEETLYILNHIKTRKFTGTHRKLIKQINKVLSKY
jgi:GTP pyrophosphokinase